MARAHLDRLAPMFDLQRPAAELQTELGALLVVLQIAAVM